jgi:hypothetical protein
VNDLMKSKALLIMMLAGGSLFAETHVSIGIDVGVPGYWAPPPPPVFAYAPPPCPGPGYFWVAGYLSCRPALRLALWLLGTSTVRGWLLGGASILRTRYYPGYWERPRWERDDDERWHHGHHWDHDRVHPDTSRQLSECVRDWQIRM